MNPMVSPHNLMPEYLTAGQVGELLQLSAKSVYRLAAEDPTFPVIKLGTGRNSSVRFPRPRLERWLADRTQGQPRTRRQLRPAAKSASGEATP